MRLIDHERRPHAREPGRGVRGDDHAGRLRAERRRELKLTPHEALQRAGKETMELFGHKPVGSKVDDTKEGKAENRF